MSSISVLVIAPGVGVVPGREVAAGAVVLVGNGEYVGNNDSVARATGEQAASPPSIPSAPTFNASLREIRFVMTLPPKGNHGKCTGNSRFNFIRETGRSSEKELRGELENSTY
jgi:hypothetical protein